MADSTEHLANPGRPSRWWRGLDSALRIFFVPLGFIVPLGRWWRRSIDHLATADRQESGLVIVLPGIEVAAR